MKLPFNTWNNAEKLKRISYILLAICGVCLLSNFFIGYQISQAQQEIEVRVGSTLPQQTLKANYMPDTAVYSFGVTLWSAIFTWDNREIPHQTPITYLDNLYQYKYYFEPQFNSQMIHMWGDYASTVSKNVNLLETAKIVNPVFDDSKIKKVGLNTWHMELTLDQKIYYDTGELNGTSLNQYSTVTYYLIIKRSYQSLVYNRYNLVFAGFYKGVKSVKHKIGGDGN